MSGPLAWFSGKLGSSLAMWGTHDSVRSAAMAKWGGQGPRGACLGCRPVQCCRQLYVPLSKSEVKSGLYRLGKKSPDGQPILARRPDGACVYLFDERCTIYARRPAACREYDCCRDGRTNVVWPSA